MRHLSLEDLARLVDEAPEPGEAAHLRDCIACRLELAELRTQTTELADLAALEPPAALWSAIEARLTAEGVLRDIPAAAPAKVRVIWWHPTVRTAAAAVLLVFAGGAAGWLWRGPSPTPAPALRVDRVAVAPPQTARPVAGVDGAVPSSSTAAEQPAGVDAETPAPAPGLVTFAAGGTAGRRPARSQSPRALAAERALRRAEADYAAALRNYAELADPASGADAATRLRALDGIVAATGDAINRDPGDPVANGYHLAAMDERQRVLKQVAAQNESTWY